MSRIPTNLTEKTSRGFFWTTGFTLIGKIVSMLCQVALAALLMEEAFGLVAMTGIVRAVAFLLANPGIGVILIQRGKRFDRWANPAFWLTLAGGFVASGLMVLTAPLIARLYDEPTLAGMIYVLAVAPPINAFTVPAEARIRYNLRFRLLGLVNFSRATLQLVLAVVFAFLGFGAYSFVLPVPITFALIAVLTNHYAHWPIRLRPQLRRWRYLLRDARNLFSSQAIASITSQADYAIIGLFQATSSVGIYFFAYNLSLQTFYLLGANVGNVLVPSLSHLAHDPRRQVAAYMRAARALATVLIPVTIFQAAMAEFGVRLLFDARWYSAIPILQLLSLGWVFRTVAASAESLLRAQGRFGIEAWIRLANAMTLIATVSMCAWLGSITTVAMAFVVQSLTQPFIVYLATHRHGGTIAASWSLHLIPTLLSMLAVLPPMVLAYWTPTFPGHALCSLAGIALLGFPTYFLLVRRFHPEAYREIRERIPVRSVRELLWRWGGRVD